MKEGRKRMDWRESREGKNDFLKNRKLRISIWFVKKDSLF